jgi:predicted negative regulator of RcsB-dependent stress response
MRSNNRQTSQGFHIVEMLIVIVLVGVIGFIGWRVWQAQSAKNMQTAQQPTSAQGDVPTAPTIKNAGDLDTASKTIDQINNDTDSQQLSGMEQELNSL